MDEEYFYWRCKNEDCKAENRVKREHIVASILRGKSIAMICANCGFVNSPQPGPVFEGHERDSLLPCKTFKGPERNIPTDQTPDGWNDCMGRTLSRVEFIKRYQVDPQINWEWRKRGCPKAVD